MNALLVPPEPSASFNATMPVHPTRTQATDYITAQEEAVDRVEDERQVRQALSMLTREEAEALMLAFVVTLLPDRKGFGIYGNLADYTSEARKFYKAKRRRLPLKIYLDRLNKRAKGKGSHEWEGRQAVTIMFACESLALTLSRKYILALDGIR